MKQSNGNQKILGISSLILAILVLVGWYLYAAQQGRLKSLADESLLKEQALNDRLERSKNEVELLKLQVQKLTEDLSLVHGSLTDEQSLRLQLQTELVQTTTDKQQIEQNLQQEVASITATTAKLEEELQRQLSLQKKLNGEIDRVSGEKGQLQERLASEKENQLRLQQQIARVTDDVQHKEAALATAQQEAARLNQQLSQTREEQARLENRVEELNRQREVDARHFAQLKERLERELDESRIEISQFKNQMTVIKLTSEVLFNSGSAQIQPNGQKVLKLIAESLSAYPDRAISIEGHTDNVPIGKHSRFTTNWQLSTARALAAVHYFQQDKAIDPQRLQVVGHGEHQPLSTNETPEGRQLNRRIEIRLMPESLVSAAR